MRRIILLTAASILITGLFSAASAYTVYFGEDQGLGDHNGELLAHANSDAAKNAFMANLAGAGTEDFESLAKYSSSPLALNFVGAGTATLTGSGEVMDERYGPAYDPGLEPDNEWFGRFAISGVNYFGQVTAPGFSIDFSDPVAAFGFYASDIGDFNGILTMTFSSGGTDTTINIPNTVTTGGSVLYFGFIDTDNLFTSVSFGTTNGIDAFGFDDLTIGSINQVQPPVPEPSTFILLGAGLAGVVFARKRVKK